MKWEGKAVYQMLSCLCLFKNPPSSSSSWMALVALLMLFASKYLLLGFGIFDILYTSLLLAVLSIILFTVSSKKAIPPGEEKILSSEVEIPDRNEKSAREFAKEAQEEVKAGVFNYTSASTSPDLLSQSELGQEDQLSTCTEDSEMEWAFKNHLKQQSQECSEGTISDEESLIEIALPSGHFVGQKKEEPKFDCSSLSADSLFSHQSLMELLAEFNEMTEEENMIEIDLSVGSIKYSSRFELQA